MLSADEYERIYLEKGSAAADAEFNRQMRKENVKLIPAFVTLAIIFILMFFI